VTGGKVALIQKRMNQITDYIAMLEPDPENDTINDMISKQNEYYNYFFNYYDNYCSLYLNIRFQFYMAVMKDIVIAGKKTHKIDIKHFIDTMKDDIEIVGYILKSEIYHKDDRRHQEYEERFFEVIGGFEIITKIYPADGSIFGIHIDELKEYMGNRSKEQPLGKKGNKKNKDMVLKKTNASISDINKKINTAAAYLITVQSNKAIGATSPLDEENALNIQKNKNDFISIIGYSKILDSEYDRFMAEVELSEINK
jgi:hypothetical protein